MVGELTSTEGDEDASSADPLLFTHKSFSISHNGPRVIQVHLTHGGSCTRSAWHTLTHTSRHVSPKQTPYTPPCPQPMLSY